MEKMENEMETVVIKETKGIMISTPSSPLHKPYDTPVCNPVHITPFKEFGHWFRVLGFRV